MDQNVVLVVEDETLIMLDVQEGLEDAGYAVRCAKNADEAFAQFDREPSRIKALVTDIKLGSGASGWEVAVHVRESLPTIPVVYMSGDSASEWSSRGVPNSVMIQKPFALAQIVTAVSSLLNQQTPVAPDENS